MTDFTKLVSSEEWKPLREAGAKAIFEEVTPGRSWDTANETEQELAQFLAGLVLSAFLTAAVQRGVAREAGGYTYANGTEWEACTSRAHEEFPVIIIKT